MRALRMFGLAVLVAGLSACASSKKEEKKEEPATQPAGQQAPSTTESASPGSPQARAPLPKRAEGAATAESEGSSSQGQGSESRSRSEARASGNVAEIDAALVSAAANARALERLGKDPSTYDRQSGQRLLDNARDSLNDAKTRTNALRASASKDDRQKVDDLDERITRASRSLNQVADRIDRPKDVAEAAGKAADDLAAAVKPLKNVAKAMGSDIEVVGPTG